MKKPYGIALGLLLAVSTAVIGLEIANAQSGPSGPDYNTTTNNPSAAVAQNATLAKSNSTSANSTGTASSNTTATSAATNSSSSFAASGRIASITFGTGPATSTTTTTSSANASGASNSTNLGLTNGKPAVPSTPTNATSPTPTVSNLNGTSAANATSGTGASTTTSAATSASQATTTSTTASSQMPYILAGTWNLSVSGGKVSNFVANFTMVHVDGTERHTHTITNFKPSNASAPITLNTSGITMISGTTDVMLNGTTKWTGVNTIISLEKGNAMNIVLSDKATDNHFKGQPIYGVIDSTH
jgi:hypothetical protein